MRDRHNRLIHSFSPLTIEFSVTSSDASNDQSARNPSSRRAARKSQRKLMGNHQRCWLWGRHAVTEALRSGRWPVRELLMSAEFQQQLNHDTPTETREQFENAEVVTTARLSQLCGSREHQGVIAKMSPFPWGNSAELTGFLQKSTGLLVLLDSLQDPHNFGAILRSAEIFGAAAVIVGRHGQAGVNSQVVRSSAGAVHHLPLLQVDDLRATVQQSRQAGRQVVAASEKATATITQCDFTRPTLLIIGNEGTGIRPELLQTADTLVAIPQRGRIGSLNAAVSAGIILYEADRQRRG